MPSITNAYMWAIQTCNAPRVGYSQSYRNATTHYGLDGQFNVTYYDCSSFVWYALKNAGFDVVTANGGDSWPFTTGTMIPVLKRLGFVEVPLSDQWLPGDICITVSGEHTEMVYKGDVGKGINMGAHGRNGVKLENQVSIGSKTGDASHISYASRWEYMFRYGAGASANWQWIIGQTNEYFGSADMTNNAHCVAGYFLSKGWTVNAIAGMLGNMQRECTLNPALLEQGLPYPFDGLGTGLVQWTPSENRYSSPNPLRLVFNALGYNYDNDWKDGAKQCDALYAEFEEYAGLQHRGIEKQWYETFPSVPSQYSMKWTDFVTSFADPSQLAGVFMYCYERAGVQALAERQANAKRWYEVIKNDSPYLPPQIADPTKHKMPVWMMIRRF